MATYSIPSKFLESFQILTDISENDFSVLDNLLKELKIAEPFDGLVNRFEDQFNSISKIQLRDLLRALVSIVDIYEEAGFQAEKFAFDFATSFSLSKTEATQETIDKLKNRLSFLLRNFKNLISTVKLQDLITENQRNFRSCRVVSDIRMHFDSELENANKLAVIVHNLKLEYTDNRSNELSDFFVSLDSSDLKKLKEAIDRAIDKDRIIRNTNHHFEFIEL